MNGNYLRLIPELCLDTVMWRHLFCVFAYIYSLLIEKDICDCRNISVKFLCVYVCLLSGDLFIFFSKSFLFLFLFLCLKIIYLPCEYNGEQLIPQRKDKQITPDKSSVEHETTKWLIKTKFLESSLELTKEKINIENKTNGKS